MRRFEVRCPIHGFVNLTEWEWEIIEHPIFQRLRRIRQLGWTDYVYPGAMHTRFEHSLGVMHVADRMFEEIWYRQEDVLQQLGFSPDSKERYRTIIRLTALLHDVGHPPFSHAGEGLMPINPKTGAAFKHEKYSSEIIRLLLTDVIDDNSRFQRQHDIKAEQIADFLDGAARSGPLLFWRHLISSQLDADRADYLLRDSYHTGVAYGRYDLNRLLISLVVAEDETENPILAIHEGGWHAAEALILARYMMFTQVYFHKTRSVYDYHIGQAMQAILQAAKVDSSLDSAHAFPPPTSVDNLRAYLSWDDWRMLGEIQTGGGGEHGEIIRNRNHYRMVYETPEFAEQADLEEGDAAAVALSALKPYTDSATGKWYKYKDDEILVASGEYNTLKKKLKPLSEISTVVRGLKTSTRQRVYVPCEKRSEAKRVLYETGLA